MSDRAENIAEYGARRLDEFTCTWRAVWGLLTRHTDTPENKQSTGCNQAEHGPPIRIHVPVLGKSQTIMGGFAIAEPILNLHSGLIDLDNLFSAAFVQGG